jgi:hypothetical protein
MHSPGGIPSARSPRRFARAAARPHDGNGPREEERTDAVVIGHRALLPSSPLGGNVHEKQIEIRWRDQDAYGHVNNAVYLTYLEEVRDEWLERRSETRATPGAT